MFLSTRKIVITGGPGTGKTVLIAALEKAGYYCFPEIIRAMTLAVKSTGKNTKNMVNPIAIVEDSKTFNDTLIHGRIQQFKKSENLIEKHAFFDRGIPDVLAYMDYFKQPYDADYVALCKKHLYNKVLVAPPWKEIYVQDNERMESFEQAKEIHHHLVKTYTSLGYNVIEIPFASIEERVLFVKKLIQ